jgi:hypothetical protein
MKEVNKHIKMYATEEHLIKVKEAAKEEGLTHSAYLLTLTNKDLKRRGKK